MQNINFGELLKDQFAVILIPVILLILLVTGGVYSGIEAFNAFNDHHDNAVELKKQKQRVQELQAVVEQQKIEVNNPNLKKIFELEGLKFGKDASFAPLFDNMIAVAKASGIRIRSVEYNYEPDDPMTPIPGYNACELTMTIVGKYSEIQRFLKSLVAEDYLINLAQIEIVSWQRDKSVLIANLKLVFYTKTE